MRWTKEEFSSETSVAAFAPRHFLRWTPLLPWRVPFPPRAYTFHKHGMSANTSLVQAFTHLKNKPKPDEALALLKRVASLVKPIMKNHGWSLPCLAEFCPTNPGLLGEWQSIGRQRRD